MNQLTMSKTLKSDGAVALSQLRWQLNETFRFGITLSLEAMLMSYGMK
jgi:hypothetical protein